METNLNGTLLYFRSINMKPNYSELARYFGVDRHTVKNMYVGKEKKLRVKKPSELDRYKNVNHGLILYKNHGQFCTYN